MFDAIRNHKKWMMALLFIFIIPSFVFFGIENYKRMNDASHATVATVAGENIIRLQWDDAHRREIEQLRAQQPGIDPQLLDSPQARYITLERLVQERVLVAAAARLKVLISDQRLAQELLANPAIAALRKPDGSIDQARLRELLERAGYTPAGYDALVRSELAQRQVLTGVAQASFAAQAQSTLVMDALLAQRSAQILRFAPEAYAAQVQPTPADLQAWYSAHAQDYFAPERAEIEYLLLDMPAVQARIQIPEGDIKAYYEQNAARFGKPEERSARHILIASSPSDAPAQRDAALKKAQDLHAQALAAPARFAELAKAHSQDPGSAPRGGDLGYFERGAMVKPFADAAFALKNIGQISEVVSSDFGYHIIELTGIRPAQVPPLEEVKAQVLGELRQQLLASKYAEAVENFSDAVFRNPTSLQAAADALGLSVQRATLHARTPAADAQGPLASRRFLQALFAPEALQQKHNTEAIELGNNQMAAGRVLQYAPAHQRPFAEVREQVQQDFVRSRAIELARAAGQQRLKAWQAQAPAPEALPAAQIVSRIQQPQGQQAALAPALVEAVLRLNPSQLPAWQGVDLGAGGYAVVRVLGVSDAPNPQAAALRSQEQAQVARALEEAQLLAYYEQLKTLLRVKILVPAPSSAA